MSLFLGCKLFYRNQLNHFTQVCFIQNLDELIKDQKVKPRAGINAMEKVVIRKDPLGVVLILGSWNYPIQVCCYNVNARENKH